MKLFKCQVCQQILHFENTICEKCSHRLGYIPEFAMLSAIEADGRLSLAIAGNRSYRHCENARYDACNWLLETSSPETLCRSCRHNRTIPDVKSPDNLAAWRKIEVAKHRLVYSLLRFNLSLPTKAENPDKGLAFDCLANLPDGSAPVTGHENGIVTIALAEADDAQRERNRAAMHEPYRTLLGHFRHEVGHYFWDRLVRDRGREDACRSLFGDERQDYATTLQRYYAEGPPADWQSRFVSAYAAAHPWEDFAETWAHYLHIVDTLETAGAFGMSTQPTLPQGNELDAVVDFDSYKAFDISQLVDSWVPLSISLNSLNRSMGQPDVYPFVLSKQAIDKLGFIHELIHSS